MRRVEAVRPVSRGEGIEMAEAEEKAAEAKGDRCRR